MPAPKRPSSPAPGAHRAILRTARRRLARPRTALLAAAIATLTCSVGTAADRPSLRDPQDGALDLSAILDTAYGFVPIVAPITEPAVGYGAAGGLVFIDRNAPADGHPVRPNVALVGGFGTENGSRGVFGGHIGHWQGGRLRTLIGIADADVNLEFFGLGQVGSGDGIGYTIAARGGVAGATYQLGRFPLWVGLRYAQAKTTVTLRDPESGDVPRIPLDDRDLRLAALTPVLTYDSRDNPFTPTRGIYADVSIPFAREALGSDRDFEQFKVGGQYYRPFGERTFFGLRAGYRRSSDGTPFFMRPFVMLRGVQAMQYQGDSVVETEAEVRWQFRPRYGFVAFGGAGRAEAKRDRSETIGAGGVGVRYLIARTYGVHMGLDVAWGPDAPVLYVIFGSAWVRP